MISEEKNSDLNKINNNLGFSIVEVLVAVAILAIVFAPLLKSFSTAAIVNGKSQRIQNATSLAEGVMEDVKGKSIQELHDLAASDAKVNFLPMDGDGGVKSPPFTVFYEDVTATKGIKYDAKVTISTDEYSHDKTGMDEADEGFSDASDVNIRELPKINRVDSHEHAVLSWELNQYDNKALENLAAENSKLENDTATLKSAYTASATKDINIVIKEDSGMTKITCEIEYNTGNSSDKSLKYLVYSGFFEDKASTVIGGPNVYLFYTLSEDVASATEAFKTENIDIEDTTSGKRHSVYLIMQDGNDSLSTTKGSKVSLNIHGSGYSNGLSYNSATANIDSTKFLSGEGTAEISDDVVFCSNLLGKDSKKGELYATSAKIRVYYVTVEIMEHGKTDVLATLTSTMQAGKEANK